VDPIEERLTSPHDLGYGAVRGEHELLDETVSLQTDPMSELDDFSSPRSARSSPRQVEVERSSAARRR
jgi:hypothetical protein